ncbi:MAG: IS110 family transposase [Chloroflexi bacterium]|nr:IS110 family transposase [Chloroflexota bacterium]
MLPLYQNFSLERTRIQGHLETLEFIEQQIVKVDASLAAATAPDPRLPLLIQLPGIGLVIATTILAAIGPISRFASASELVGYAGLGTRVHDSGETHKTGRITKAGRRDLRYVMVEAAQSAARTHPFWKGELERLQVRLGRKKAIVAIARKLLVVVWHVLTKETVDRHAHPQKVACSLFALAYKVGVRNLPDGQSAAGFTRQQLDRLGIGQELTDIPWGTKRPKLPASRLGTS